MNIALLFTGSFPYGSASANRILSYSQEIVKMGHDVTVLCLTTYKQPFKDEEKIQFQRDKTIFYNGVKCVYPSNKSFWPHKSKNILKKTYLFFKGIINTTFYLFRNKHSVNIIHYYGDNVFLYFYYTLLAKIIKLNLVVERAELPDIYYKRDLFVHKIGGRIYTKFSQKAFSIIKHWLIETQTLADYYLQFSKGKVDYCIVPMTVDIERFEKKEDDVNLNLGHRPYIGYCGNMREIDGVSILIKAFSIIKSKYPEFDLKLAGDSLDVPKQKELVKKLGLEDRVFFLGRLSFDDVPLFLKGASLLALASPVSERSVATMPCKVGEYLCTGNPIIVTGIGEIPRYLKDRYTAFLAEPNSEETFASKMDIALQDTKTSHIIGKRGKEVAIHEFNSKTQAERIINYFKKIILLQ